MRVGLAGLSRSYEPGSQTYWTELKSRRHREVRILRDLKALNKQQIRDHQGLMWFGLLLDRHAIVTLSDTAPVNSGWRKRGICRQESGGQESARSRENSVSS